jgi:rare lipoprotein A
MIRIIALFAAMMQTPAEAQTIVASWYEMGKITASGEKFNPKKLTAAHRTLPFGTKLKLKYKDRKVIVTINDRGPFIKGRHIDLSRGAAKALKMEGVQKVELLAVIPVKKHRA